MQILVRHLVLFCIAFSVTSAWGNSDNNYTDKREKCSNHQATKQALFGDLHVHTSYSFDSYVSSQRNDPWKAYEFAKGMPIVLADESGDQAVRWQLQRPLDFTSVTDHAEYLGEMNVCTQDSSKLAYWTPHCIITRSNWFGIQLLAVNYWSSGSGMTGTSAGKPERSYLCNLPGKSCAEGASEYWQQIQLAAEEHYDRSSDCEFTTFVGYEYTDAPDHKNLHRNVIFRNENVIDEVISTFETGRENYTELWQQLREQCIEGKENCDVISIPHNPNLSGGTMFPDPKNKQQAQDRLYFEPLVELVQHKGASECRYDRLEQAGLYTTDELCTFEQVVADNLSMLGTVYGEVRTARAAPVSLAEYGRRNMVRNVLKDGLALEESTGINPFKMGFIGSTDTHSAAPGGAEEDNYKGHLGKRDSGYRNVQDHFFENPGGLAVVWAEENSRNAIFDAFERKEAYSTSGTRPLVRFFAGDYPANICEQPDMLDKAYAGGVPMGGDIKNIKKEQGPTFIVSALKDAGSAQKQGTDIQRVQVIKGWLDAKGKTHEQVFDVAGGDNGASVDSQSCAPIGKGLENVCATWHDPNFNAEQSAFYYVRVVENPTCRWTTLQCKASGVDPFAENCTEQAEEAGDELGAIGNVYGRCCIKEEDQPFYSPVIQERAWTSPIWYRKQ